MRPEKIIAEFIGFDEFMGHEYRIPLPMVTRYETNFRIDSHKIIVAIYRYTPGSMDKILSEYRYKFYGVDIT